MQVVRHEPFDPYAKTWDFDGGRPLSDANGALPWIIFDRDRDVFRREFPQWDIEIGWRGMPFRYLLSGGVASRMSAPEWTYPLVAAFEQFMTKRTRALDMFAIIILTRRHLSISRHTSNRLLENPRRTQNG